MKPSDRIAIQQLRTIAEGTLDDSERATMSAIINTIESSFIADTDYDQLTDTQQRDLQLDYLEREISVHEGSRQGRVLADIEFIVNEHYVNMDLAT